ncbi:MAG: hypothetical protein ACE5NP_09430 [Anaerolineae bacterium]
MPLGITALQWSKSYKAIVVGLIVVRILMVIAVLNGLPETPWHDGWYLHHGGDQIEYTALAVSLAKFEPKYSFRTLGFPLLLVPFVLLFYKTDFHDILAPVVIFHSIILFSASTVLVVLLAERLTRSKTIALLSAALWVFYPYILYLAGFVATYFSAHSSQYFFMIKIAMVHQFWTQILSDPPSTFFVLLAVFTFVVSLQQKERELRYAFWTGLLFAFAVLIRLPNMILILLFLPVYLYTRWLKAVAAFGGASILVAIPQLVYNWHFFRSPLNLALLGVEETSASGRGYDTVFSIAHLVSLIQRATGHELAAVVVPLTFAFLLCILVGLAYLWKLNKMNSAILLLWIFPYMLFIGAHHDAPNDILRLLMPIAPAIIIAASSFVLLIWNVFAGLFSSKVPSHPPLGHRMRGSRG